MKIQWMIEAEEGIDPENLLGAFKAADANGEAIEDSCIYLDSVFFALSEGLINSITDGEYISELIDEPDPFIFKRNGEIIHISYKKSMISTTYREAVSETCRSYNELYCVLEANRGVKRYGELNESISKLCATEF